MIVFALIATGMTLLALLFVLPVLLTKTAATNQPVQDAEINLQVLRDQLRELDNDVQSGTLEAVNYASSKQELEFRVAQEVLHAKPQPRQTNRSAALTYSLLIFVPLMAITLYLLLGNPLALNPAAYQQPPTKQPPIAIIEKLAQQLKSQPDNADGWNTLARAYYAMGRFNDAAAAYARLIQISPTNPDYLVSYAITLAILHQKNFQGEPEQLLQRALALNPTNVRALSLAGSVAYERRDYAAALVYWKSVLPLIAADSELSRSTINSITEAQHLISVVPPTVSGTLALDPQLQSRLAISDTDTVFIYARAVDGPKFPLAVLRTTVKQLPLHFTLDDSMAVVANSKLSDYPHLILGARISHSGSATASSGDAEAISGVVDLGAVGVKLNINSIRK